MFSLYWLKVKYLNFAITQSIVNIFFTEISHADKGTIDLKHIKWDLVRRHQSSPLGGFRGWDWGQSSTFSEDVHVAYAI